MPGAVWGPQILISPRAPNCPGPALLWPAVSLSDSAVRWVMRRMLHTLLSCDFTFCDCEEMRRLHISRWNLAVTADSRKESSTCWMHHYNQFIKVTSHVWISESSLCHCVLINFNNLVMWHLHLLSRLQREQHWHRVNDHIMVIVQITLVNWHLSGDSWWVCLTCLH